MQSQTYLLAVRKIMMFLDFVDKVQTVVNVSDNLYTTSLMLYTVAPIKKASKTSSKQAKLDI